MASPVTQKKKGHLLNYGEKEGRDAPGREDSTIPDNERFLLRSGDKKQKKLKKHPRTGRLKRTDRTSERSVRHYLKTLPASRLVSVGNQASPFGRILVWWFCHSGGSGGSPSLGLSSLLGHRKGSGDEAEDLLRKMLAAEEFRSDVGCSGLSPSTQSRRESWVSVASSRRDSRVLQNDLLLHEAVIKNEVETVEKILKEPVDVNSRNNYGRAPLHWASSRGSTDIMKMLIAANCDLEAQDKYGMRPIHMAAWHGHRDAAELLVASGASLASVSKKRFTLLMCAAKNNRVDVMSFLEETVDDLRVDEADASNQTALHHAAAGGHLEAVRKLVGMGARIDCADEEIRTPLHWAAEKGHAEVAAFLLRSGASANARDKDGNLPLHLSTENRQTRATQALLDHGNPPDLPNGRGLTALHLASGMGCRGIVESLLRHGSDVNALTEAGNSPLHLACRSNEPGIVELLIREGADVNRLNFRLESPIHIAAESGFDDVCQLLVSAGASAQQKDQGGKTPLHAAARGSFASIVDMLIKTAGLDRFLESDSGTEIRVNVLKKIGKNWRQVNYERPPRPVAAPGQGTCAFPRRISRARLDEGDRKKMAARWALTHEQTKAVEHRHTGLAGPVTHRLTANCGLNGKAVNALNGIPKFVTKPKPCFGSGPPGASPVTNEAGKLTMSPSAKREPSHFVVVLKPWRP